MASAATAAALPIVPEVPGGGEMEIHSNMPIAPHQTIKVSEIRWIEVQKAGRNRTYYGNLIDDKTVATTGGKRLTFVAGTPLTYEPDVRRLEGGRTRPAYGLTITGNGHEPQFGGSRKQKKTSQKTRRTQRRTPQRKYRY